MPIPKLKVEDLRSEAIELFKEKAVRRGRLTPQETKVEDFILLDNLHLIDEDGYLIRAAMLAFCKDPEKCRKIWILRINCLQNIFQNPTIPSLQIMMALCRNTISVHSGLWCFAGHVIGI